MMTTTTLLVLLANLGLIGEAIRDKTGPSGSSKVVYQQKNPKITDDFESRSFLAEREGFEPSLPFPVNQFSRLTHSTALPPLQVLRHNIKRTRSRKEGRGGSGL